MDVFYFFSCSFSSFLVFLLLLYSHFINILPSFFISFLYWQFFFSLCNHSISHMRKFFIYFYFPFPPFFFLFIHFLMNIKSINRKFIHRFILQFHFFFFCQGYRTLYITSMSLKSHYYSKIIYIVFAHLVVNTVILNSTIHKEVLFLKEF